MYELIYQNDDTGLSWFLMCSQIHFYRKACDNGFFDIEYLRYLNRVLSISRGRKSGKFKW